MLGKVTYDCLELTLLYSKVLFQVSRVLLLSEHENVDLKPSRDVRGLVVVDMFL